MARGKLGLALSNPEGLLKQGAASGPARHEQVVDQVKRLSASFCKYYAFIECIGLSTLVSTVPQMGRIERWSFTVSCTCLFFTILVSQIAALKKIYSRSKGQ